MQSTGDDHPHPDGFPDLPAQDENGVDLDLLRHNLSLTPAQRLEQNARFAELMQIAREAGRKYYQSLNRNPPAVE